MALVDHGHGCLIMIHFVVVSPLCFRFQVCIFLLSCCVVPAYTCRSPLLTTVCMCVTVAFSIFPFRILSVLYLCLFSSSKTSYICAGDVGRGRRKSNSNGMTETEKKAHVQMSTRRSSVEVGGGNHVTSCSDFFWDNLLLCDGSLLWLLLVMLL